MVSKRKWQTKSVLVVEDDLDALDEMTEALRDHGLTVHEAVNATQAVSLAKEKRPAFVLMDFNLPGANGLQAAAAIRRFLPAATFIMMSGMDNFCRLATTENTQTFAVLKKPIAIDSIARFMRNSFQQTGEKSLSAMEMLTA